MRGKSASRSRADRRGRGDGVWAENCPLSGHNTHHPGARRKVPAQRAKSVEHRLSAAGRTAVHRDAAWNAAEVGSPSPSPQPFPGLRRPEAPAATHGTPPRSAPPPPRRSRSPASATKSARASRRQPAPPTRRINQPRTNQGGATRTAGMPGRPISRRPSRRQTAHRSLTRHTRAPPPHNDTKSAPARRSSGNISPPPAVASSARAASSARLLRAGDAPRDPLFGVEHAGHAAP